MSSDRGDLMVTPPRTQGGDRSVLSAVCKKNCGISAPTLRPDVAGLSQNRGTRARGVQGAAGVVNLWT
jgi:hypothetical protein